MGGGDTGHALEVLEPCMFSTPFAKVTTVTVNRVLSVDKASVEFGQRAVGTKTEVIIWHQYTRGQRWLYVTLLLAR